MPAEPGFRYRESLSAGARQRKVVRNRMRNRRRVAVSVVVILLLVPAGLLALRSLWTALDGSAPDVEAAAAQKAAAPAPPKFDPRDPFDATPAAQYAVGAEGIAVPVPTALGGWSAKDVGAALATTKQALISARLDPAVLVRRDSSKYLATMSESARAPIVKDIKSGAPALGYVTRLAPGYTLAGQVRTKGTMTVTLGTVKQLVMTTDVVWVYPLQAAGPQEEPKQPGTRLVILHTMETYEFFPAKGYSKKDRGLRPGTGEQGLFNMDCALAAQGLLALPRTAPPNAGKVSESRAFDLATRPTDFPATC